jgi:hypothetical protein
MTVTDPAEQTPTVAGLLAVPEVEMPPGRIEAMHAALLREISAPDGRPVRVRVRQPRIPARLRSQPRLRIASGLALGVLAATLALNDDTLGGSSGSSPQAAFAASWTAIPQTVPANELAGAVAACEPLESGATKNVEVAVAEARGTMISLLLTHTSDGNIELDSCDVTPDPNHPSTATLQNRSGQTEPTAWEQKDPGNALHGLSGWGSWASMSVPGVSGGETYGEVAPSVAKVEIDAVNVRTNAHLEIQATVSGGWYYGWWPGMDLAPDRIVAYAADGSRLQDQDDSGLAADYRDWVSRRSS